MRCQRPHPDQLRPGSRGVTREPCFSSCFSPELTARLSQHISHPSIVSYLHSFTTPTHHCLVLEALQGGELFELLDEGDNHSRLTVPLLRRMFGELCQAVGWMHGVGLVHRDLKLESQSIQCSSTHNTPLTHTSTQTFSSPPTPSLHPPPSPSPPSPLPSSNSPISGSRALLTLLIRFS